MNVRKPDEFESRLRDYLFERAEETRAVRVGEKTKAEQAAILARYADLFSEDQRNELREAWDAASAPDERERLFRLRATCESGLVAARTTPLHDALQNAELASDVSYRGDTIPLRTAFARMGTLPDYADREALGRLAMDAAGELNDARLELVREREQLRGELSGEPNPILRNEEEKGVSLSQLAGVLADASDQLSAEYEVLRVRWLDTLMGKDRDAIPSSYHASYVYRLFALAHVYSKERSTDVCLATLSDIGFDLADESSIRIDLEDRPQKTPRAAVIPSDPPAVVHLVTRAQGGLQDYLVFLHEAGHALHFAGCDADLPYTFRKLSRDNALTEVYSYTIQAIVRQPAWHERHFHLSPENAATNAEAARYLDLFMFRRNVAKLHFELEFWGRFTEDGGTSRGYAERLTDATGFAYRPDRYLADMDADFYSADYLRAGVRAAQLRAHLREEVGTDWWRRQETGEVLRALFREGTRPSNEELAERLGYEALDTGPLVQELMGSTSER